MGKKQEAEQAVKDLIEEVEPKAKEQEDDETLEIIDNLKDHLEHGEAMLMVKALQSLKSRVADQGYDVNLD